MTAVVCCNICRSHCAPARQLRLSSASRADLEPGFVRASSDVVSDHGMICKLAKHAFAIDVCTLPTARRRQPWRRIISRTDAHGTPRDLPQDATANATGNATANATGCQPTYFILLRALLNVGSVPDLGPTRRRVCSRRQPRAKHASFEKQFPCGNTIRSVLCNVVSASRSCRTPGRCTVRWRTAAGGTIRSVLPRHCARLRQCRECQKIFPLQHVPVWRYLDVCVCQRRRSAPMCDGADTGEAYKFRTQIFEVVFCTCLRWRRLAKVCAGYAGLRSPCYGQK